jgi:hypothetical protein
MELRRFNSVPILSRLAVLASPTFAKKKESPRRSSLEQDERTALREINLLDFGTAVEYLRDTYSEQLCREEFIAKFASFYKLEYNNDNIEEWLNTQCLFHYVRMENTIRIAYFLLTPLLLAAINNSLKISSDEMKKFLIIKLLRNGMPISDYCFEVVIFLESFLLIGHILSDGYIPSDGVLTKLIASNNLNMIDFITKSYRLTNPKHLRNCIMRKEEEKALLLIKNNAAIDGPCFQFAHFNDLQDVMNTLASKNEYFP